MPKVVVARLLFASRLYEKTSRSFTIGIMANSKLTRAVEACVLTTFINMLQYIGSALDPICENRNFSQAGKERLTFIKLLMLFHKGNTEAAI